MGGSIYRHASQGYRRQIYRPGAGKYQGYYMNEIKDELAFVVKHVPAFNQWFKMPGMREEQGYAEIPYYENWAYYLELELFPLKLNVTRVASSSITPYMDFDNKTFSPLYILRMFSAISSTSMDFRK